MRLAFPRPSLKLPRLRLPRFRGRMAMADHAPERPRIGIIRSLFTLRGEKLPARLILAALAFGGLYMTLAARIVHLQVKSDEPATASRIAGSSIMTARPQIVDRNGVVMATDVKTVSVYADPRKVTDKDEAAELINAVFPNSMATSCARSFRRRMPSSGSSARSRETAAGCAPPRHSGIGFLPENKRVYPSAKLVPTSLARRISTTRALRASRSISTGRG